MTASGELGRLPIKLATELCCCSWASAFSGLDGHLDSLVHADGGQRDGSTVIHVAFGSIHFPSAVERPLLGAYQPANKSEAATLPTTFIIPAILLPSFGKYHSLVAGACRVVSRLEAVRPTFLYLLLVVGD